MMDAGRAYRLMLRAFPPDFRRDYTDEMLRVFSDRRRAGRPVWTWAIADLIRAAPRLRWEESGLMRTTIVAALAALAISVASSLMVIGARSAVTLTVSVVVHLVAFAMLVVPPVMVGRRRSRTTETVYVGRARRAFTWWLVPAVALAVLTVVLGVQQLVSDPKIENVAAMAVFTGFAAMTVGGIVLRASGRNLGNVLIAVSVIPFGSIIWFVYPPVLALAVMVPALVEIGATSGRTPAVRAG